MMLKDKIIGVIVCLGLLCNNLTAATSNTTTPTVVVPATPSTNQQKLIHAVMHGNPGEASSLLNNGLADANQADQSGNTPLFFAHHLEMAKVLVEKGGIKNVNVRNNDGVTPLDMAIVYGENKVVEYLLSKGADVNAADKNGLTPLHYATAMHRRPGENVALAAAAVVGVVSPAALGAAAIVAVSFATRNSIVRKLLDAGANPNAKDNNGNTPLHILAEGKEGGAGSELEDRKKNGVLVAQILVAGGFDEKRNVHLAGADLAITNNAGKTPYQVAGCDDPLNPKINHRPLLCSVLNPKTAKPGVAIQKAATELGAEAKAVGKDIKGLFKKKNK